MEEEEEEEEEEEDHHGLSLLPENCLAEIISKTSVKDACSSSAVSLGFKSASESDFVWEKFLPCDYQDIISSTTTTPDHPLHFTTTKKELFFLLCDSNILLNDGTLSLWLCKKSGKKCYMLRARDLSIAWQHNPSYWIWKPFPQSRFSEVGELLYVWWLDIRGKIQTKILSPKTTYAAYVVYKVHRDSSGLEAAAMSSVKYTGDDENNADDEHDRVHLTLPIEYTDPERRRIMRVPQRRMDGWMEIYLGCFYNDQGEGEIEMQLSQTNSVICKKGLILEGIEVRPM